ncbi:MAG: (2Fe-2S)-binding protein, partial [Elusimicrobia bacterium]|nr:(2Fe-2S)-binding protein [Elusimicrobiota bacterium]
LKSRPGATRKPAPRDHDKAVYPVLHCHQEIPCNPCVTVCPKKSIKLDGDSIMNNPSFAGDCIGCFKCILICPGLAVTMVDYRKDKTAPTVAVPFEIERGLVKKGDAVRITDWEGASLGTTVVGDVKDFKAENTLIVIVKATPATADKIASVRLYDAEKPLAAQPPGPPAAPLLHPSSLILHPFPKAAQPLNDDSIIICRCERVALGEIRKAIKSGVRDMNQLKAVTRAGMGACGAKTCESLILSVFKSEGVDLKEVTGFSKRPLFLEAPLGTFSNAECEAEPGEKTSWSGF